jgi:hypothetical protein
LKDHAGDGLGNPGELMSRFPYMFPSKNLGYDFALGWFPGFVALCENIDRLLGSYKRGFHWTQLKEKMGSGRYHYAIKPKDAIADSSLLASIRKLVESAEAETLDTCIYCGEKGLMHNHRGYMLVRCDRHKQLADAGMHEISESPWFQG